MKIKKAGNRGCPDALKRLAEGRARINQGGSEGLRKVKWEPKAVRKEEKEETGQGHLEVLMSSERMGGAGNLHKGLRKKVVKIFPVAFKLIHMHDSYGLYGMWYMETQLFLVYSIRECSVESSQASYRTDCFHDQSWRISLVLKSLS